MRLTDVNGTLFFSADNDVHGGELWKGDGTEAGTHGQELWMGDGTAEGTLLVKDIYPGNWDDPSEPEPEELTDVNGTLFFSAYDDAHGSELWVLDVAGSLAHFIIHLPVIQN